MRNVKYLLVVFAIFGAALVILPAPAGADGLDDFFGRFVGRSLDVDGDEISKRDFDVTIEPADNDGFRLTWRTFFYKNDGRVKKKDYSIEFRPSQREGIYTSLEKKDMFGNRIPSDPMKGEAYIWAVLSGKKLTVHGFVVTDDGGFEMQAYHRRLTSFGMDLEFTRHRESGVFRRITGTLQRVDE